MRYLFIITFFTGLGAANPGQCYPDPEPGPGREPDCLECHQDLLAQRVVHPVAEDACDNCHLSNGNPHPENGTVGFTLMDRLPDLCFYCHEEPAQVEHGHAPVEEGACLSCHDVHGSSENNLLKLPEEELCLSCHGGTAAIKRGSVDIRRLITGNQVAHSAITGGGCITCHQAHGSDQRALLVAPYPSGSYVPAEPDHFELCFLCHDTGLMEEEETSWATGFRDGTTNLHHLHIRGEKGRNCRLCHNLHGSPQPFLIEEQVSYGAWVMEMNFKPVENGGSCLPGCHGKLSYAR
jgi:predicted CXXCH cytochrome family protein